LGTRYALLRPEFGTYKDIRWGDLAGRPGRGETAPTRPHILVTLGGSDPDNLTLTALQALATLPDVQVKAVIGALNRHRAALAAAAPGVELLSAVHDMPALMAWADVAVAAGGSTAWELAFMGLPAALIVLADNQRRVAAALGEAGIAVNLGECPTPEHIADAVSGLLLNADLRRQMRDLGRAMVDGRGAARVVDFLRGEGRGLTIRPATLDDMFQVWTWANDPLTRANSFSTRRIPWETHVRWYRGQLAAPATRLWLLESDGLPVAQIRYDRRDDCAEIGYTVAPGQRGRGYGTRILQMTAARACRELDVPTVRGLVMIENRASIRAFEQAGFTLASRAVENEREFVVFESTCSGDT
jgi:RimJ/RimL family protein N-acetyltransferase